VRYFVRKKLFLPSSNPNTSYSVRLLGYKPHARCSELTLNRSSYIKSCKSVLTAIVLTISRLAGPIPVQHPQSRFPRWSTSGSFGSQSRRRGICGGCHSSRPSPHLPMPSHHACTGLSVSHQIHSRHRIR
jgi:hypothetical protein